MTKFVTSWMPLIELFRLIALLPIKGLFAALMTEMIELFFATNNTVFVNCDGARTTTAQPLTLYLKRLLLARNPITAAFVIGTTHEMRYVPGASWNVLPPLSAVMYVLLWGATTSRLKGQSSCSAMDEPAAMV